VCRIRTGLKLGAVARFIETHHRVKTYSPELDWWTNTGIMMPLPRYFSISTTKLIFKKQFYDGKYEHAQTGPLRHWRRRQITDYWSDSVHILLHPPPHQRRPLQLNCLSSSHRCCRLLSAEHATTRGSIWILHRHRSACSTI